MGWTGFSSALFSPLCRWLWSSRVFTPGGWVSAQTPLLKEDSDPPLLSLSLSLSLSLTHTHTHTHILSLSHILYPHMCTLTSYTCPLKHLFWSRSQVDVGQLMTLSSLVTCMTRFQSSVRSQEPGHFCPPFLQELIFPLTRQISTGCSDVTTRRSFL